MRPGVFAQAPANLVFAVGLDHVQGLTLVAQWATQQDESVHDEPVHENGVLAPPALLTDRSGLIPVRAPHNGHGKIGHWCTSLISPARGVGAKSGDDGDRTHDLRLAKPALYQLSYIPEGTLILPKPGLGGPMMANGLGALTIDA